MVLAVAFACAPQGPAGEMAEETAVDMDAARSAVEEVVASGADAFSSQDWEAAEGLLTDDWAFYSDMGRTDFAGLQQFFTDHITEHTIDFTVTEVVIAADASIAWASWDEQTSYMFDGEATEENAVFTGLFENTDDGWLMASMHRSVVQPMEGGEAMEEGGAMDEGADQ